MRWRLAGCLLVGALVLAARETDGQIAPPPPAPPPFEQLRFPPVKGDDPRWPAVRGMGICSTDYGWCPLPYPERVTDGAPCYCVTEARQRIDGVATLRMYYGNVNPYFNPWR